MLTDILDMSKIEAGKYEIFTEPFKIGHTLANCCAMMRGQAEQKKIEIVGAGFDALPEITADERAVRQIMINLLSNAVKFTDEGGRVKVEALRAGRNCKIAVSDNGIGISEEHLAQLGMPFYQADSKYRPQVPGHRARPFRGSRPRRPASRQVVLRKPQGAWHDGDRDAAAQCARDTPGAGQRGT